MWTAWLPMEKDNIQNVSLPISQGNPSVLATLKLNFLNGNHVGLEASPGVEPHVMSRIKVGRPSPEVTCVIHF
jgi:hypothetical protein